MIYTALDNFYLTAEQLEASPSRADGVDAATEAELRRYCCDVVAEAAVLLRLPQVVAATAQVLIQRFYCKRSLKDRKFDVKVGAARGWRRFGAGPRCRSVSLYPTLQHLLASPNRRSWPWPPSGLLPSWRR